MDLTQDVDNDDKKESDDKSEEQQNLEEKDEDDVIDLVSTEIILTNILYTSEVHLK